jgi:hypothetical protein
MYSASASIRTGAPSASSTRGTGAALAGVLPAAGPELLGPVRELERIALSSNASSDIAALLGQHLPSSRLWAIASHRGRRRVVRVVGSSFFPSNLDGLVRTDTGRRTHSIELRGRGSHWRRPSRTRQRVAGLCPPSHSTRGRDLDARAAHTAPAHTERSSHIAGPAARSSAPQAATAREHPTLRPRPVVGRIRAARSRSRLPRFAPPSWDRLPLGQFAISIQRQLRVGS